MEATVGQGKPLPSQQMVGHSDSLSSLLLLLLLLPVLVLPVCWCWCGCTSLCRGIRFCRRFRCVTGVEREGDGDESRRCDQRKRERNTKKQKKMQTAAE